MKVNTAETIKRLVALHDQVYALRCEFDVDATDQVAVSLIAFLQTMEAGTLVVIDGLEKLERAKNGRS